MEVLEAALHEIRKDKETSGEHAVQVLHASALLPLDNILKNAAEAVLANYTKKHNAWGVFGVNEQTQRFPVILKENMNKSKDFLTFSIETTDLIAKEMSSKNMSTGGHILFLHYENASVSWLMVVKLRLSNGTGVDDKNLQLTETRSFNMDNIHEAARVNLQSWQQDGTETYLSFIKGRGDEEVSKYFRDALGCTDYTDSKKQTQAAMIAIQCFFDKKALSLDDRKEKKKVIHDLFFTCYKDQKPINLIALSAYVDTQNPNDFKDFIRENGIELQDEFKPHAKTFSSWKRVGSKFKSISLSFDLAALDDQTITYDQSKNTITIGDIPDKLAQDILQYKNTDLSDAEDATAPLSSST